MLDFDAAQHQSADSFVHVTPDGGFGDALDEGTFRR
jgi:hypothetical protein